MNKQELERASAEIYALMRDSHLDVAGELEALSVMVADPSVPRLAIGIAAKARAKDHRVIAMTYNGKVAVASQEAQHAAKANQQGVESGD